MDTAVELVQWRRHIDGRVLKYIYIYKYIYNSLNFFYLFTFKKNRNTLKKNQEHLLNFYAKQILN